MQVCPTLCIYSVSTWCFLYSCNFILLLYFNYLTSLTGTVQSWCINDPEQLFLRIPMKPYVFLTKMFLHSQINTFLLMPLQPWLIAAKAKGYMNFNLFSFTGVCWECVSFSPSGTWDQIFISWHIQICSVTSSWSLGDICLCHRAITSLSWAH